MINGDNYDDSTSDSDIDSVIKNIDFKANEIANSSNDNTCLDGISDQYFLRKMKSKKNIDDKFFETFDSLDIDGKTSLEIVQDEYQKICDQLKFSPNSTDMRLHYSLLMSGFNLILYGYGSKINLLNYFMKSYLNNKHYIVLKGYLPEYTLKDVILKFNNCLYLQFYIF